MFHQYSFRPLAALLLTIGLVGCGSYPGWIPSSGPSVTQTQAAAQSSTVTGIQVIDLSGDVTRRQNLVTRRSTFAEALPGGTSSVAPRYLVGAGDVLEVSIWEAPPAALFGVATIDSRSTNAATRVSALPEQVVNSSGNITIPYAGQVRAAGRSPQDIDADIVNRLRGKANQPQVMVRVVRNATSNATVVGEVTNSTRLQLSPRGERVLDALAAAGGVRQPFSRMSLQLTRGDQVVTMPLDAIIADPRQNVVLQPGDVVTALYQPNSFTVLGATGRNEELNFEAQGITLAQALARSGGLQDHRADARGVFVFRFEDPRAFDHPENLPTTPEGRIPVVYRADLKDPASFFLAQGFPMRNKDVIYVSNAPAAELQKFLTILSTVVYSVVNVKTINN